MASSLVAASTLSVVGAATMASSLVAASTLSVVGEATMASTLTVNNDVTINGELVVTGGLTVSGQVAFDGCAGFNCASDRRLKRNIIPLENSLAKISSLRGVYFSWVQDEVSGVTFDSERHIGLMAQDVKKVIPEAVKSIHGGKYLGVDYTSLIPYMIEAIRAMKEEYKEDLKESKSSMLEELREEMGKFRRENDMLANRIYELEKENESCRQSAAGHKGSIEELRGHVNDIRLTLKLEGVRDVR
jgi:FtsZ-binding cell division protein ZapB